MEERRTFRERAKGAAKASAKFLKKLSPERAMSRLRLNMELDKALSAIDKNTNTNWLKNIMELVQKGANPNLQTMDGYTPLFSAVKEGNAEACAFLIGKGADVSAANKHGRTALHAAARWGRTEICVLIIREYAKAGRNVTNLIAAKDGINETPLHDAASKGNAETCALLIKEYSKAGGDADKLVAAKNDYKNMALHLAASNGHTKTCALLIEKGSDIAAKGDKGRTAEDFAFFAEGKTTMHFLILIKKLSAAMGKEAFSSFMKSFGDCVAG
jgi:ankyrin repeat protein